MEIKIGHTRNSVVAVERIKSNIKREVHTFRDIIPEPSKELLEKRTYMQSDEFWNDPHNMKMTSLCDRIMELRDKIKSEIAEKNKTVSDKIVQATNGFPRIKKCLEKKPSLNFCLTPMFLTETEGEYSLLRTFRLGVLSREEKKKSGIRSF